MSLTCHFSFCIIRKNKGQLLGTEEKSIYTIIPNKQKVNGKDEIYGNFTIRKLN